MPYVFFGTAYEEYFKVKSNKDNADCDTVQSLEFMQMPQKILDKSL